MDKEELLESYKTFEVVLKFSDSFKNIPLKYQHLPKLKQNIFDLNFQIFKLLKNCVEPVSSLHMIKENVKLWFFYFIN